MTSALLICCLLQQPKFTTPASGSRLRTEILDVLRKPVEKSLGVKVKFLVREMRYQEPWCFVGGTCLDPKGKEIDLLQTKLKGEADTMDGASVYGLLKRDAKKKWSVKAFVLGPTDVAYDDWDTRFGCPRPILGLPVRLK